MQIEIETREFEFSHGKKPRGEGNWAFRFRGPGLQDFTEFAPGTLSFSEAKKWARSRAVEVKAYRIEVCS